MINASHYAFDTMAPTFGASYRSKQSSAEVERDEIELVNPPTFPVIQSRWVFASLAGELLFVATTESVMAFSALAAFPEFAECGALQWFVAGLFGSLLALIVLYTEKPLAYAIKKQPSHRHRGTSPHWMVCGGWRVSSAPDCSSRSSWRFLSFCTLAESTILRLPAI